MATDIALNLEIGYQFDCRRVAILEKIYLKKYKCEYKSHIHNYFWNILSHTLTHEYMSRHPEKCWDHNCECTRSVDKIIDEKTLAEIEDQIKKMNETDKVPICECDECDEFNDVFITHRNNWIKFSTNPNVSLELIEKYWDKEWNIYCLAKNQMTGAKAQFKKEYLAALKIQEAFLRAKFNPAYAYCRKLHSEFYKLL